MFYTGFIHVYYQDLEYACVIFYTEQCLLVIRIICWASVNNLVS